MPLDCSYAYHPASKHVDGEQQIVGPGAVNYTTSGVSRGVALPTLYDHRPSVAGSSQTASKANVFVAGSVAIDLSCDYALSPGGPATGNTVLKPALHTSNPASITQSLGGVGGNVARAAHLMGANVQLCSAVGKDLSGSAVVEALRTTGMSTAGVLTLSSDSGSRTAQYVAVNDSNKDLVMGMADMTILESATTGAGTIGNFLESWWLPGLQEDRPSHLILDANWSSNHLGRWLEASKTIKAHVSFEPVSTAKSRRLFALPKPSDPDRPSSLEVFPNSALHLTTPNAYELTEMYTTARESGAFDRPDWWSVIDAFGISHSGARVQLALATSAELVDKGVPQQSLQLLPFIPSICTKLGKEGVLLTQLLPAGDERLSNGDYAPYILSRCANGTEDSIGVGGVYMRLFPSVEEVAGEDIVSVNGVGDTFLGALIAGMAMKGPNARVEDFVDLAQRAAVLTLKSKESVSPGLGTLRILL